MKIKATALIDLLKSNGLSEDNAKAAAATAIQKGECEDDLGIGPKTSMALRGELLAKGLTETMVDDIVKGAITRGEVTADVDETESDDLLKAMDDAMDELHKAADALSDAAEPGEPPEMPAEDDPDRIYKGFQIGTAAVVAKSDEVIAAATDHAVKLTEAFSAVAETNRLLCKAFVAQKAEAATLRNHVDAIAKALELPLAPRSLRGFEPLKHPGEAGANGNDAIMRQRAEFLDKGRSELVKGGLSSERRDALAKAMYEVEANLTPASAVAASCGITLGN